VLMHYSPIEGTVEGEPKEIYPYLGSSRLEEPLTRYPVDAVFHGHAHHGAAEGRTRTGVPVYNVSINLLHREQPDGPLFRFVDLPVDGAQAR
jgi:Icc-related predicted phosphoesterase